VTPSPSFPSATSNLRELPIRLIERDGQLWPRQELDAARVVLFRDLLAEQLDVLPPLLVVADGDGYLLADGWHRLAAYDSLNVETVPARVVEPGDRDPAELAFVLALREAVRSAQPLTTDERRAAVLRLAERGDLTQVAIAKLVGVSESTVSRWLAARRWEAGQQGAGEEGVAAAAGEPGLYTPPDEDAWALALRGLRLLRRAHDLNGRVAKRAVADFIDRADDERYAARFLHTWAAAMLMAAEQVLGPVDA
jgi:ParB-like chromosome segregation protein Spo0J